MRRHFVEPFWSRADAIHGSGSQATASRKRPSCLRSLASDCHQLRPPLHGKEGVDGSSPSEGSAKPPHAAGFAIRLVCRASTVRWVWSRLWSFAAREGDHRATRCRSGRRRRSRCWALLGLGSAQRRPSVAELAGGTGWTEEGRHFISAIAIEVDEVALPTRRGSDSAALTIATDEVRGNQTKAGSRTMPVATSCPFRTGAH